MQAQDCSTLFFFTCWWLFFKGVEQQIQECSIYTTRGLDDPWDIALLRFWVGIAQILPAILAMARKIPILPPVDTLPLLPAKDALVLNVIGLLCIMRQLIRPVCSEAQPILMIDDALVPFEAILFPIVKPLLHLAGMHEELQVPLLELALAKQEITGCDFVTKSLANLADTKRNLYA